MKYIRTVRLMLFAQLSICVSNCVEPFDIETESFESILVINATITNELKNQQIVLSRTFRFEEEGPLPEQNAQVKVVRDTGEEYFFDETTSGVYISKEKFAVTAGNQYQLLITTQEERSYISDKVTLPPESSIENLYPKRMFSDDGVEGLGIFIDSFDANRASMYYRFEYEETYKITAPLWVTKDLQDVLINPETGMIEFDLFTDRPLGERICYNTRVSNEIILANTSAFEEDRIIAFPLKFIDAEDISVADRYSILVRQFVQSREAGRFYETLKKFSDTQSLFSQIQPGFITGNIISENNPEESVLGLFDLSSVSKKRIFFNRGEVLEGLPQFMPGCEEIVLIIGTFESIEDYNLRLIRLIEEESAKFFEKLIDSNPGEGFYIFVQRECGDCTVFGQSIVPDFWID